MVACDLGSNTIRFVEIECKTKQRLKEFEKIVKTAEGLSQTGIIGKKSLERVIDAILEAKEIFDFSQDLDAVTTEAIRVAKNQKEVIKEIYEKTGVKFRVIDGDEEAYLTNLAVKSVVNIDEYLLVDIGGGSTEISVVVGDKINSKSFNFGIVTMTEKYGLEDISLGIERSLKDVKKFFKDKELPKVALFTSGTPTTVCAFLQGMDYENYDYKKINRQVLTVYDIKKAKKELLKLPYEQRVRWVGVGREDLIISGIEIFLEILKLFKFKRCFVVDDGLREGVALHLCYKKFN